MKACAIPGLAAAALLALGSNAFASPEAGAAVHAEVGKAAPDFTLTDLDGEEHSLSDFEGKMVVLEWFNPDCPFVKKHHEKNKTMRSTYQEYADKDVVWLAINSGAPGQQGHGKERNGKAVEDYGIAYPLLLDESGEVGMAYGAKTTPHMYVIDTSGTLVYMGAIDDDRSPNKLGETNHVKQSLDAVLAGESPDPAETKSYGCSVKYAKKPKSI